MYVKTEDGKVIQVEQAYKQIHEIREDDLERFENNNYGKPEVKPVNGTSSWQLFWKNLIGGKEICIATFDSVNAANNALSSLRFTARNAGWDAIEYKEDLLSDIL